MNLFPEESIVWKTKNKKFILTSHRIRQFYNTGFKRNIKSVFLEDISSIELKTRFDLKPLKWSILSFILLNGIVFLINNWLFKSKLIGFFFEDPQISQEVVTGIFIFSIVISVLILLLFFLSINRVFIFHANGLDIELKMNWVGFDKRDAFISLVEKLKNRRLIRIQEQEREQ